jgi:hypothetical protein
MIASMEETFATQKPRRKAVKASVRPSGSKAKCTLVLSVEASQRLSIHSAMCGEDRSTLVDRLIKENLRRYVVSDRAKSDDQATMEVSAS